MIDLNGLDDQARAAVARAEAVARELGLDHVGTEHLLLGLLAGDSAASRSLLAAGATRAAARRKVAETVAHNAVTPTDGPVEPTARAARAIGRAHRFSDHDKAEATGAQHVLLGILDVEGTAGQVLRGIGVDVAALRAAISTEPAEETAPPATTRSADPAPAVSDGAVPTCPRCDAAVDGLTFRVVPATDADGRAGDAVVFSCRGCGVVLGVTRANPPRSAGEDVAVAEDARKGGMHGP